jgi:hypothetical protein
MVPNIESYSPRCKLNTNTVAYESIIQRKMVLKWRRQYLWGRISLKRKY